MLLLPSPYIAEYLPTLPATTLNICPPDRLSGGQILLLPSPYIAEYLPTLPAQSNLH